MFLNVRLAKCDLGLQVSVSIVTSKWSYGTKYNKFGKFEQGTLLRDEVW